MKSKKIDRVSVLAQVVADLLFEVRDLKASIVKAVKVARETKKKECKCKK
jgi:hypothetical protein